MCIYFKLILCIDIIIKIKVIKFEFKIIFWIILYWKYCGLMFISFVFISKLVIRNEFGVENVKFCVEDLVLFGRVKYFLWMLLWYVNNCFWWVMWVWWMCGGIM